MKAQGGAVLPELTTITHSENVALFNEGQSLTGAPFTRISRDEARSLVASNDARWVNRGKAIQVRNYTRPRDASATMGPRVIELAARGSKPHKALVLEWAPKAKERNNGHQNDAGPRTAA